MKRTFATLCFAASMMLASSVVPQVVRAAEEEEAEPLGKGPVHEAYAQPHEGQPKANPVIAKQPPKPVEELPPDQKPDGDNVQWIPGYWAWDEDRTDFLWVSGFWRVAPPGRTWIPGSWRPVEGGHQWTGGLWQATKDGKPEIEYLPQPPAPLDEAGPNTPAPNENHTYVPGNWVYKERYLWRPGFWAEHRPNWVWTPACYRWTHCGYVYTEGFWDYPLADRGCLFAPVHIPYAVYSRPAFVFTPSIVVNEPCLYGAFFARRGFGAYYFGDYFAPRYSSLGFVAWSGHVGVSLRIGGFYDPLFSHYSCGFRNDPFWRGGINDLYVGRFRGNYHRPPVNLVQQNTVINNITKINNTTNNVTNVTMLNNINDPAARRRLNLQTVDATARRQQQQSARDLNAVALQRSQEESKLIATRPAGRPLTTPQQVKLTVPTTPSIIRSPIGQPATGGPLLGTPSGTAKDKPNTGTPGTGGTPAIAIRTPPNLPPAGPKPTAAGINPPVGTPGVNPGVTGRLPGNTGTAGTGGPATGIPGTGGPLVAPKLPLPNPKVNPTDTTGGTKGPNLNPTIRTQPGLNPGVNPGTTILPPPKVANPLPPPATNPPVKLPPVVVPPVVKTVPTPLPTPRTLPNPTPAPKLVPTTTPPPVIRNTTPPPPPAPPAVRSVPVPPPAPKPTPTPAPKPAPKPPAKSKG